MKTRSLYLLTALVGALAFTVPWLLRLAAQDSPIGSYSMSEWAHYQLNVNRVLETGQVGKVIGYTGNGTIGVVSGSPIPEAPLGTLLYARSNALWQAFPPGLSTLQTDAPDNGLWYSRRNGEWQNFLPGGGSGTNVGGTNRLKLAALAEFRPPATNGTLLPANTATFIRVNHIFDPDGIFTGVDTNAGSFRLAAGYYAITMVVPVSVAETGGGNVRIPFTIALFDLTTTNDVYYQTYTVYDEDLSQYNQVFLPALVTDGTHNFTIRVFNHHASLDLQAGQAGGVAGLENHYTEIQFLKIDGIAGLPEAPINSSLYARSNEDWLSFTIPSTNGFIPEAPTDGQTYGRRGSDASWQVAAGGGADTNAVASVLDTNALSSLSGYTKSWVGPTHTMSGHALWSLQPWSEQADLIDNGLWYASTGTFVVNPDGSGSCTDSDGNLGGTFAVVTDIQNAIYYIAFQGKADTTDCILRNSSSWTNPQWEGETNLLTSYRWYFCSYTAAVTNALSITAFAPLAARTFTIRDFYWSNQPFFDEIRNAVVSPTEGMAWKRTGDIYPDALADGQTYGRKDGAWAVVTGGTATTTNQVSVTGASFQFAPTAEVIEVTSTHAPGVSIDFTGQPVVLPGVEAQYLTIYNKTTSTLRFPRNSNPTFTGSGVHCPTPWFALAPGYVGYLRYRTDEGLWDGFGTWPIIVSGLEATLLPAPWGPPDADGNQTIRDAVQDALIDALLPRLLDRLGLSAGTLPAPAPAPRRLGKPGTRANPIDWPAAPEPAAAAGKYNINIQIGDQ